MMSDGESSLQANSCRRVVVALVISNLEYGGAQRQLVALANNLDPDKFEVHVFSLSSYAPLRDDLTIPGSRYHEVQKTRKYDYSIVSRLRKQFSALNVDVVHTFLFDAEIAGRVAGWLSDVPRIIGSERNSDYVIKRNQMLFYRLTKSMRHHCIANSSAGAEFNADRLKYPIEHYSVVRNSVDLGRFQPGKEDELKQALGYSRSSFVVGMFASFKLQKNHIQFLKALHLLRERGLVCQAMFIGDILHSGAQNSDHYYTELQAQVSALGIGDLCEFVGNQDAVERYYRICDVTVLPSLFEGTPNVVLESMASGVPAIVTDVADNSLIIEDGITGFVIPVGDSTALAGRLGECIEDKEMCRVLGGRARDVAEQRFSPARLASDTAAIYLEDLPRETSV